MLLGPLSVFIVGNTIAFQSVLGPFRPLTETDIEWGRAAQKNAAFFADLMEGWDSDASAGNTNRLRIDSFDGLRPA